MTFRIYVDEAGTHDEKWLVIGMLFVPDHGALHADLARVKEEQQYFNTSPRRKARYRETHLAEFRTSRDVAVAKQWIELFVKHSCYYRCVVVDWSIWDGSYFGGPFDPPTLKKRKAYKKWAEMLLHHELKHPTLGSRISGARLFLDHLRIAYGYDVITWLEDRFTEDYHGADPYIREFQHTQSWHDANQCLQLCDLLTSCMYQALVPSDKPAKVESRQHLERTLQPLGVRELGPRFWRGYASNTLSKHFPKFSAWYWQPNKDAAKERRGRRR